MIIAAPEGLKNIVAQSVHITSIVTCYILILCLDQAGVMVSFLICSTSGLKSTHFRPGIHSLTVS